MVLGRLQPHLPPFPPFFQCFHISIEWRSFVTIKSSDQNFQKTVNWLVVSTPLKNISQNGNLPQIGVKIKKN